MDDETFRPCTFQGSKDPPLGGNEVACGLWTAWSFHGYEEAGMLSCFNFTYGLYKRPGTESKIQRVSWKLKQGLLNERRLRRSPSGYIMQKRTNLEQNSLSGSAAATKKQADRRLNACMHHNSIRLRDLGPPSWKTNAGSRDPGRRRRKSNQCASQ